MVIRNALLKVLAGCLPIVAATYSPPPDRHDRIECLENALLAPCCYSEPVSTHNSEIAARMRAEITAWVSEGKSDREILDTYKRLYGLRVLVEPEGPTWWWLSIGPWVVVAVGTLLTVLILRRWRQSPPFSAAKFPEAVNVPDMDFD